MASGTIDSDLIISVHQSNSIRPLLGDFSDFHDSPHPGTNNPTRGFQWGRSPWQHAYQVIGDDHPGFLLDANSSSLNEDFFQSGVGDIEKDLAVLAIERVPVSGYQAWVPKIRSGWYWDHNRKHYLFSDQSIRQMANPVEIWSGYNSIQLEQYPKPGAPVLSRMWQWDSDDARYETYKEINKVVEFTGALQEDGTRLETVNSVTDDILPENVDTTEKEFLFLESDLGPPLAVYNQMYSDTVGQIITASGQLHLLDQLGTADGRDYQEFHTTYSPVWSGDNSLRVYSYPTLSGTWNAWDIVDKFTGGANECIADYDMGVIQFGAGIFNSRPQEGHYIGATYIKTPEIEYEPSWASEYVYPLEESADVNPVRKVSEKGFVVLRNQDLRIGSISLTAEVDELGEDYYGPVEVGNNFVTLLAEVRAGLTGELLEGIDVTFRMVGAQGEVGSFSGDSETAVGITSRQGIARAFWTPPRTIDDIGRFADTTSLGPPATLTFSGVNMTSNLDQAYLFKVWKDDPVQGIPLSLEQEVAFYSGFFVESGIYGITGLDDPNIAGYFGDPILNPSLEQENLLDLWEYKHRIINGLLTPTAYNRVFRNGRKQIVTTFDSDALNPVDGSDGAYVPLQPTSATMQDDSDTVYTFADTALDPVTGDLDGYYLVAPGTVAFQAEAFDEITGQTLYSNIITINIRIPDSMNGTYTIGDINSIPDDLVSWTITAAMEGRRIPLGWRLRTTGNTIASSLNAVTFIPLVGQ